MSLTDGTIGNRRNTDFHMRVTREEDRTLENMAASYNMDKSDFARLKIFGRHLYDAKSEINNAIERIKNGYQRTAQRVKNYFIEPEDVYLPAYAPAAYGTNTGYR